jgi:ferredoxin-type protein NapG
MSTKISRRNLFRLRLKDAVQLTCEAEKVGEGNENDNRPMRPPGALEDEESFLTKCHRCTHCSEACPHDAIIHLGPVAGDRAEGTPVLRLETHPCHWCVDFPCVEACPSGALARSADGIVAPVAKVELNLDLCLNSQGILCDTCAVHCPPSLRAVTMKNRMPQLDSEACVGCGLCVYVCEAEPRAIGIGR